MNLLILSAYIRELSKQIHTHLFENCLEYQKLHPPLKISLEKRQTTSYRVFFAESGSYPGKHLVLGIDVTMNLGPIFSSLLSIK